MKLLLSEIIYSLRSNKINYILNVLIVSFIIFLFIFSLFMLVQINSRESAIKQMVKGKNMYDIQDTLFDDEFYSFRQDETNINNLADFYNCLNQSEISKLISVFDQPLFMNLEQSNDHTSGENTVLEFESLQLNEQAFDFYNIQLSEGNNIEWNSIKAEAYEIPVLLGSNYRENYSINDIICVQYYMKNVELKVIGFKKKIVIFIIKAMQNFI